jgi:hypothetical protein
MESGSKVPIRRFLPVELAFIPRIASIAKVSPSGLKSTRLECKVIPCVCAARLAGCMADGRAAGSKRPAPIVTASTNAPGGISRETPDKEIEVASPACTKTLTSSRGMRRTEQSLSK